MGRKKRTTSVSVSASGGSCRKKPRSASKSAAATTEVPAEVMTNTEAELFHARLECAAKQLRLNRTQVFTETFH